MKAIALALALAACSAQVETVEPTSSEGPPDVVADSGLDCSESQELTKACALAPIIYGYVKGYPGTLECPSHASDACDRHWVTTPDGQKMAWCCP